MDRTADDAESSGLFGEIRGDALRERRELVDWLKCGGFDVDQISESLIPMLLPANRVFGDGGTFVSTREVAQSSGLPIELVERLHRAVGLARVDDPDKPVHRAADAMSIVPVAGLIGLGIDADQVVVVARLLAEGLSHAAAAMRQAAFQALVRPGASEAELAQALEALALATEPLIDPIAGRLARMALRQAFETEAVSATERASGTLPGARPVAVAFADLVGFTRLGEVLPPEELAQLASQLGNFTRDVVSPPVQFVKTIGDAVMLVSQEPQELLRTVVELVESAAVDDFPQLRVGLATGLAVSRAGDWYGSPVNLASRVTDAAPPGVILVTESARAAIGDVPSMTLSFAETRDFKGIQGEVRLFRASRA